MKRLRRRFLFLFLILAASFLQSAFPNSAHAFPGFARKYNFPCSFCHISWPRLADTGHFFKDRGFMLSNTGRGNGLDMMFMRPDQQDYFPIGFHMGFGYHMTSVNGIETNSPSTQTGASLVNLPANYPITGNGGFAGSAATAPSWDIESGGLIAPWISFWVQPGAGFDGGYPPGAGDTPGSTPINTFPFSFVKLWIRFDDIFHTTWLNLYVGKSSNDFPESTYRSFSFDQVATGDGIIMEDYQPGMAEIAQNGVVAESGFALPGVPFLYVDGDDVGYNNAWTGLRFFGYKFEGEGEACHTSSSFSVKPCETRYDVYFVPNSGMFGTGSGDGATLPISCIGAESGGCSLPSNEVPNSGWNYTVRLTQSFGGWGRTNGEQIGAWTSIISGASVPAAGGGGNPQGLANREGAFVMLNPIPNGNLNIDGGWDVVNDPSNMVAPALAGMGNTMSGLQYMAWWVDVSWMPTFGGLIPQTGAGSNVIELIYNQVDMTMQPQFTNFKVPGNFNDVLSFQLIDRYWLWGSDRADVSLFADYQFMVNDGVAGVLSEVSSAANSPISNASQGGFFGNVEANSVTLGIEFAY